MDGKNCVSSTELYNIYFSSDTVGMVKPQTCSMHEDRSNTKLCLEGWKIINHLGEVPIKIRYYNQFILRCVPVALMSTVM